MKCSTHRRSRVVERTARARLRRRRTSAGAGGCAELAVASPVDHAGDMQDVTGPTRAAIEQQRVARKCGIERGEPFGAAADEQPQQAAHRIAAVHRASVCRRRPAGRPRARTPVVQIAVDDHDAVRVDRTSRQVACAPHARRIGRRERAALEPAQVRVLPVLVARAGKPSSKKRANAASRRARSSRLQSPAAPSSCVRSRADSESWRGVAFTRPAPPVSPSRNHAARAPARATCRRCAGFVRPTARARSRARCSRAGADSA